MMLLFAASGHLVVRGTSPSSRGPLKRKGGGKTWNIWQRGTYNCRVASLHRYPCQSAQHLRSRRGLAPGTSSTSRSSLSTIHGDTCCVSGAKFGVASFIGEYVSSLESSSPGKLWRGKTKRSLKISRIFFNHEEFAATLVFLRRKQDAVRQVFAQNIRTLEVTKDHNWKDLFDAAAKLVWSWKSWFQNVVTVMEVKSRSILWRKKGFNLGWSSAGMLKKNVMEPTKRFREPWKLLRWKKGQSNFYRVHFRGRFCRSSNKSGKIYLPLMTTIAETFQTRRQ